MEHDDNTAQLLIKYAKQAYRRAYAPYSSYKVGAAVLADDGSIYTGCNIENAVYPLTSCAERVAITKAVSEGAKRILAVAVVTENGGTPCGSCRQIMREFADDHMQIYIADIKGDFTVIDLQHLLPDSFSASDLPQTK
jgi:cytidine deaminase